MTADSMEIIVEAERSMYTDEEWAGLKRDRDALSERLNGEYRRGYDTGYKDAQYFFRSYSPEELELENDDN